MLQFSYRNRLVSKFGNAPPDFLEEQQQYFLLGYPAIAIAGFCY